MTTVQKSKFSAISPDVALALQDASTRAAEVFSAAATGNLMASLEVAASLEDLRALFDLPEVRQRIIALQDAPIGFRTDKDPRTKARGDDGKKGNEYNTPYDYNVVKDCAIEAGLRGLQLVGNQFNIISRRTYVTKEGFEALFKKLPKLTDWKDEYGVPKLMNGGAIVDCKASWKINGTAASLSASIPVKADGYSGADQILGKAKRKLMARCYGIMTGSDISDGEIDDAQDPKQVADAPQSRFAGASRPKKEDKPAPAPVNGDPVAAEVVPADQGPQLTAFQSALAEFVTGDCLSTFDKFVTSITRADWLPEGMTTDGWTGFGDIPDAFAGKLLNSKRGIVRELGKEAV